MSIMSNKWNFKIELTDQSVFEKLEGLYGQPIPDEFRKFIIEANASNPERNLIVINGVERVFESVFSFNENETETVSVFQIIESGIKDSLLPFGMDPSGNIYYYSLVNRGIVFYNHEEDSFEKTDFSLESFIAGLQ